MLSIKSIIYQILNIITMLINNFHYFLCKNYYFYDSYSACYIICFKHFYAFIIYISLTNYID